MRPGQSFIHNFTVEGQIGTLLWHAHISWLRATLHGAIVIFPKPGVRYPFNPQPDYAVPIILGTYPLLFHGMLIIEQILLYFLCCHTRCWNSMDAVSHKPLESQSFWIISSENNISGLDLLTYSNVESVR